MIALIAVFLIGSAILGLVMDPDFVGLQRVWNVVASILGGLVGYYLTGNRTGYG